MEALTGVLASYSTADPADPNQLTTVRFHELFCCCAFCV